MYYFTKKLEFDSHKKLIRLTCTILIPDEAYKQGCAPSVLILFINMMLFGSNEPEAGCKEFMFEGQGTIQRVFVLVALACIPVMLLGKPLYLLAASKKKNKAKVFIQGF